eukprot:scaffold144092_cov118-Phaeocystis_antarctica.AAC.1
MAHIRPVSLPTHPHPTLCPSMPRLCRARHTNVLHVGVERLGLSNAYSRHRLSLGHAQERRAPQRPPPALLVMWVVVVAE